MREEIDMASGTYLNKIGTGINKEYTKILSILVNMNQK